jgi:hypothetical protein
MNLTTEKMTRRQFYKAATEYGQALFAARKYWKGKS